jgi:hypothetical protein
LGMRLRYMTLPGASPRDGAGTLDACSDTRYSAAMIVGFRHKGLKRLFESDDAEGIRSDLLDKVRTILAQLSEAQTIEDMRITSFRLHRLQGDRTGLCP